MNILSQLYYLDSAAVWIPAGTLATQVSRGPSRREIMRVAGTLLRD